MSHSAAALSTATYFVARDGEDEHGEVYLWRVVDGNVNACEPVLRQRDTDPNVWEASVDALDGGLPEGVAY